MIKYLYDVEGKYMQGSRMIWEVVTCETDPEEARDRLREYDENEPGIAHRIRKRRDTDEA